MSRIFSPEPAAASGRLAALAQALHQTGFTVEVFTVQEPSGQPADVPPEVRIHRAPVLRDTSGYVRGVLQYLSFDLPVAVRLLVRRLTSRRRPAAIIVEPPPTSGAVVRVMSRLLGAPYIYYAADIWVDALRGTDVSSPIQAVMAWIERFALRQAALVLTVSPETTARVQEIAGHDRIHVVPHGVDTTQFTPDATPAGPEVDAIYTGMASERHGAEVFIEALPAVLAQRPQTRVLFLGYGSRWEELQQRAEELQVSNAVEFAPPVPAEQVPHYLRNATISLASLQPDVGYDYAFPTKIYSALATGTPVLFAGVGPAAEVIQNHQLGWVSDPDASQVARLWLQALQECEQGIPQEERMRIAQWVQQNRSVTISSTQAAHKIQEVVNDGSSRRRP